METKSWNTHIINNNNIYLYIPMIFILYLHETQDFAKDYQVAISPTIRV